MSNRRSLIGEVSLPKTSEKVWNRISGTVSFDMGKISFEGYIDFPLQSNIDVRYTTSLLGNEQALLLSGATRFDKIMGIANDVNDFKILSWTPLEDDNYKYIVFPMHLEVGDNGDKGKVLYEYLMWIIDVNSTHLDETDIIWIDGNKAGNPAYFYQWFPIIKDGYIEFNNTGLTHYKLYPSGLIQKYSQSGGMP